MNLPITHVVRLRNCSSLNGPAATSPDLILANQPHKGVEQMAGAQRLD